MDRIVRFFARLYRRYGRARARQDVATILRAARATMRRKSYCALATHGLDGTVSARVVQPSLPSGEDLVVFVGTSPTSRKTREVEADDRVTLVYEDDRRSACVVIAGHARRIDDAEMRHAEFRPMWTAFFPEGPDVDFTLLRIVPDRIEVVDFTRFVTPEPFGLRAAVLVRERGAWREAT